MKIFTDKTGFPLVEVKELGLISLWPITKVQFERFMADASVIGDKWYDTVLKLNPRVSYKYFDRNDYEKLFLTGIKPQEALQFARWLGEDFDLPTVDEWRSFYQILESRDMPSSPASAFSMRASAMWIRLRSFARAPRNFALMEDGLVEWVRKGTKYIGVGSPRHSFLLNAYDPLNDVVVPIEERLFYFGFRLIKRQKK